MGKLFRKLGLAAVIAAGFMLAEAGARDQQAAHAATWKMILSNNGASCEGCCPSGQLCCEVNHPCSVTPIDQ
jgi:hypothetical protein